MYVCVYMCVLFKHFTTQLYYLNMEYVLHSERQGRIPSRDCQFATNIQIKWKIESPIEKQLPTCEMVLMIYSLFIT